MRKPRKGYKTRRISPQERVLQVILLLGMLFIIYQGVAFLVTRGNQPIADNNSTKMVGTLISTINYRVSETTDPITITAITAYPSPTLTLQTNTPLATTTPEVKYLLPAKNYLPALPGEPGNYSLESEGVMDLTPMRGNAYKAHFTNSYPLYHDSDDAYSVLYKLYVFADTGTAVDYYDAFTMDSLISIYESTYSQRIYPTPIDRIVDNIDAIRMFCFNFVGTLKPEIHCQVILRDENLVAQVTTMVFNTGSSITKAISQAKYFTDMLIINLE